jgi:hypothetical protein
VETPGLAPFQPGQLTLNGMHILRLTSDADQGTGPAVAELSDLAIVLADAFVEPSQDIWAQCLSGIPDELFPVHGVHAGSRPVLKRSRSSMSTTERSVLNSVMG